MPIGIRLGSFAAATVVTLGAIHPAPAATGAKSLAESAWSLGSPTDGALRGGVALEPSAAVKLRWPDGPRWGLPELVRMLERGALRVRRRYPSSVLLVGELSRRQGGTLPGHSSHESGRDADVGFYFVDGRGRAVRPTRMMQVGPDGKAVGMSHVRFDEARTWALVESFLTDPEVVVQNIFVAEPLRERLLAHARGARVSPRVLRRASLAMSQPRSGKPHDDHLHVRIACPPGQRGLCVSEPGPARLTALRASAGGDG